MKPRAFLVVAALLAWGCATRIAPDSDAGNDVRLVDVAPDRVGPAPDAEFPPDAAVAPDAVTVRDATARNVGLPPVEAGSPGDASEHSDVAIEDGATPPDAPSLAGPGQSCRELSCGAGLSCEAFDGAPFCVACGQAGQPACPSEGCAAGLTMVISSDGAKTFCVDTSLAGGSTGGTCRMRRSCDLVQALCEATSTGEGVYMPCGAPGTECCCGASGCTCNGHVCVEDSSGPTVCR